ncbi:hypothetical protein TREES_T100002715 [Tupaia chinensis]|uniref:Uncharacterized protein n=1 Tax=Tupaia chinensis TaxID=246437 RepID=L9L3G4_TUPCH|nr:hypothetical protein TREES_T100002715 [Tupaia chinensis]
MSTQVPYLLSRGHPAEDDGSRPGPLGLLCLDLASTLFLPPQRLVSAFQRDLRLPRPHQGTATSSGLPSSLRSSVFCTLHPAIAIWSSSPGSRAHLPGAVTSRPDHAKAQALSALLHPGSSVGPGDGRTLVSPCPGSVQKRAAESQH